MPYEKQIFADGEVLTAEQLNKMEQGIFDATEKAEQGGGEIAAGEKYDLIESITTTEEVKEVKRTEEPDGTGYAFKQIFATMSVPVATAAGAIYIRVNKSDNSNVGFIDGGISNTAVRYSRFNADVSQGLLFAYQTPPGGANSNVNINTHVPSWGKLINIIDQLRLITSGSTAFPVGTKIDIYGVRA